MIDRSSRLLALDVFRGATVAAMLLVNNPGNWAHVYPPLLHAAWHGWTPTDLIFPFFLFVVGVTSYLSLDRMKSRGADTRDVLVKIGRRGALIILAGLLLNWFPFFAWGEIDGVTGPGDRIAWRWQHLRWSGVLQRIGVVYLISAPLVWSLRRRAIAGIVALVLVGYAALLLLVPVPDTGAAGHAAIANPDETIVAWTDRILLGRDHIWRGGMWDPEGPLSTVPAVATALLGSLAAPLLRENFRTRTLVAWGVGGCIAGLALSPLLPINKNLWTSTYVLFTAGVATLLLAATMVTLRDRRPRMIAGFFATFGLNPFVAFVGSGLMARLLVSLIRIPHEGRLRPLQSVLHDVLFASWLPPRLASLCWAIAFVLTWFALLRLMEKRGWVVKI